LVSVIRLRPIEAISVLLSILRLRDKTIRDTVVQHRGIDIICNSMRAYVSNACVQKDCFAILALLSVRQRYRQWIRSCDVETHVTSALKMHAESDIFPQLSTNAQWLLQTLPDHDPVCQNCKGKVLL
jgi:hypothetical protein